jgi:hypothetical protein
MVRQQATSMTIYEDLAVVRVGEAELHEPRILRVDARVEAEHGDDAVKPLPRYVQQK